MANNVKFFWAETQAKYDAAIPHDPFGLYFVIETQRLYKGEMLLGTGSLATSSAAGLLSPEDYQKLQGILENHISATDSSIVVTDMEDGSRSIGVAISKEDGNSLNLKNDGLYVAPVQSIDIPQYAIEKLVDTTTGSMATYRLKKTVGEEVSYVGDSIEINKEIMLKGGSLEIVSEENAPYQGANVGDYYLDLVLNDDSNTHIYIPVNNLVDTVSAGTAIDVTDNIISVKIAKAADNAISVVDGGLYVKDHGLTSADKTELDKLIAYDIPNTYVTNEALIEAINNIDTNMYWEEISVENK